MSHPSIPVMAFALIHHYDKNGPAAGPWRMQDFGHALQQEEDLLIKPQPPTWILQIRLTNYYRACRACGGTNDLL